MAPFLGIDLEQVFMVSLPGIERIKKINILTKEGNANLDIL